ncbi:MAG: RluA family pseudouridine synthase [Xanthomonadales bacterium]|nr:RluA family pseudouridine synthase [Xanthomonadales bacterium]
MDSKPKVYARQVRLFYVPEDRDGQRLDNFLARHLKGVPRGAVYRLIRTGQVRVNGGRAKPDRKLAAGDAVRIPPVTQPASGEVTVSESVCRQVEAAIIYEDDDLIVIDKPSGMAVHAGSGLAWGLIDAVRKIRPNRSVELAHRIDRETSGCLVLACNRETLIHLADQFREGTVAKRYLCLLSGQLDAPVVEVDAAIAAERRDGEKHMAVGEEGKGAMTRFTRLEDYPAGCYAQAEILTGRTHQIRVHARHIGAPLAGDRKYGREADNRFWRGQGLRRMFLHAAELDMTARSGERLNFSAALPLELRECLDRLAAGATGDFPTPKG